MLQFSDEWGGYSCLGCPMTVFPLWDTGWYGTGWYLSCRPDRNQSLSLPRLRLRVSGESVSGGWIKIFSLLFFPVNPGVQVCLFVHPLL